MSYGNRAAFEIEDRLDDRAQDHGAGELRINVTKQFLFLAQAYDFFQHVFRFQPLTRLLSQFGLMRRDDEAVTLLVTPRKLEDTGHESRQHFFRICAVFEIAPQEIPEQLQAGLKH